MRTYSSDNDQIKTEDTIRDMAEARTVIKGKLEQIQKLMQECNQEYRKYSHTTLDFSNNLNSLGDLKIGKIMNSVDYTLWSRTMNITQIEKFVTSQEKSDMMTKMYENPPEYTSADAYKTVHSIMNNTEALATSMIKKIYSEITNAHFRTGLRNQYKKPNQAKLSKSFRFSMFFRELPTSIYHDNKNAALIQDLERVCYMVDGKVQPSPEGNIVSKICEALRGDYYLVEGDYFNVQLFKNGNVKIDFKDEELVKRINLWGQKGNELPNNVKVS